VNLEYTSSGLASASASLFTPLSWGTAGFVCNATGAGIVKKAAGATSHAWGTEAGRAGTLVGVAPAGAGTATAEARARREAMERSENCMVILTTGLMVIDYGLKVKFGLSYWKYLINEDNEEAEIEEFGVF